MDHSLSFYLNGFSVYCQYYAYDRRVQLSIALKIEDKDAFRAGKYRKDHAAHMNRLKAIIYAHEVDCRQAGRAVMATDVENLILSALRRKQKPHGDRSDSVLSIYRRFIAGVKSGEILNQGRRYSASWVAVSESFVALIEGHEVGRIQASRLSERDLMKFSNAITGKGQRILKGSDTAKSLSQNTVTTYMAVLIGILNNARRMGWFKGPPLDTKVFRTGWDNIDHGQYLKTEEIAAIAALPYSGHDAELRDVFVLGCSLGMRFSDLSRLTPKHRSGNLVNINTRKTGAPVWVPLSTPARAIWDAYNGLPTLPARDGFTKFIKRLGRDAKLDKPVLFSRTENGERVERWVPKWELLGTHTMRRSFSTNAFKAGVAIPSIMKITGHKATASFLKYIRISDEEHAELVSSHPFFS